MKAHSVFLVFVQVSVAVATFVCAANAEESSSNKKFKYGYVISHKEGGSQAHVESRDGNMALGRYYVNFPNGSGQKVTYFADDVGFHTGVSYSSRNGKGSSNTQIAVGHKALAALGNFDSTSSSDFPTNAGMPHFASKALATDQSSADEKFNISSSQELMSMMHHPTEAPTFAVNHSALPSPSPSSIPREKTYTGTLRQSNVNAPENVGLKINQYKAEMPEIKTFPFNSQGSGTPENFARPSRFESEPEPFQRNDSSFSKERSIERTNFFGAEAQLISEIQKHAEGIIMKDMKKEDRVHEQSDFVSISPSPSPYPTATMQPIVVTASGDTGLLNVVSSTPAPDLRKFTKDFHSANSLGTDQKTTADHSPKNSGFYHVSLSPPYASSADESHSGRRLIGPTTMHPNSEPNNSTTCGSNLCESDNNRAFSNSLFLIKPTEDIELDSDISSGSNTYKLSSNFYPQNRQKEERHYVTTIDVQKGISLDVKQNEDGSIQLATNFPFNKLPSHQRQQHQPTSLPRYAGSSSISSNLVPPAKGPAYPSTPKLSFLSHPPTPAPPPYDTTQNQNVHISTPSNDISFNRHTPGEDAQKYVHILPQGQISVEILQNSPSKDGIADLKQEVELVDSGKNNQEFRQPILYKINSQHDEQRKQKFIEDERKQYLENLRKVEELKQQNSASPKPAADLQSNIIIEETTSSPSAPVETNSVETTAVDTSHDQYNSRVQLIPEELQTAEYQTQVSDYVTEIPRSSEVQHIQVQQPEPVVYSKPVPYESREFQSPEPDGSLNYYESPRVQNVYIDNSVQPSSVQNSKKLQLAKFVDFAPVSYTTSQPEKKIDPHLPIHQKQVAVPESSLLTQLKQEPELSKQSILLNPVVPLGHGRTYHIKQPLSFLGSYPLQLQAESQEVVVPALYELPHQFDVPVSVQIPTANTDNLAFAYPHLASSAGGQLRFAMTHTGTNKLRIQPLKPSPPAEEETQTESFQNSFPQPQYSSNYYFAHFPLSNRLQLRHIGKKKHSHLGQPASQTLVRRDKALKNLKIEYGFKPPLRPSVEFSEEVKPSIYGPSVPVH